MLAVRKAVIPEEGLKPIICQARQQSSLRVRKVVILEEGYQSLAIPKVIAF